MKAKYYSVLPAIVILLLTGCSSDNSDIVTSRFANESLGYLPLSIDNSWNYKTEQGSIQKEVTVTATYQSGDKVYYLISSLDGYSDPDTIRIEENKILRLVNNSEIVWFDFNLEDDSEYQYNAYTVRVDRNVSADTYLGKFTNCIGFYFDIPEMADEEVGYVFAKGIGVVRIPGAWVDFKLSAFDIKN